MLSKPFRLFFAVLCVSAFSAFNNPLGQALGCLRVLGAIVCGGDENLDLFFLWTDHGRRDPGTRRNQAETHPRRPVPLARGGRGRTRTRMGARPKQGMFRRTSSAKHSLFRACTHSSARSPSTSSSQRYGSSRMGFRLVSPCAGVAPAMISPQKKQIQVFIAAADYRAKHP